MIMKIKSVVAVAVMFKFSVLLNAQTVANNFDKNRDIFIAQFDSIPDPDDIMSQAAVGSLLAHSDFAGVNYLGVSGAYGEQIATRPNGFIDSTPLFNLAFGPQAQPDDTVAERAAARWVNAHGGNANYVFNANTGYYTRPQVRKNAIAFACEVIIQRVKPVLQAGGKVYVMEAGQSDLTAEWVEKLIKEEGITNTATNVILVQHSDWNERHTPGHPQAPLIFDDGKNDWEFINNPENLTYWRIDDGNTVYGTTDAPVRDRGNEQTPDYKDDNNNANFLISAMSANNPNAHSRALWTLADQIITDHLGPTGNNWSFFRNGYVDFSDSVEAMWIFDLAHESVGLTTVNDFWETFVVNTPVSNEGSFVPDPNKVYHIENPTFGFRLASNGSSENAYTTSLSDSGSDTKWKFTQHPSGLWHLDRAEGGVSPRLRSDNTTNPDMQATAQSGAWTQYTFTPSITVNGTYYLDIPGAKTNFQRLRIRADGKLDFAATSNQGAWPSLRIVEAEVNNGFKIVRLMKRNATSFGIHGNQGSNGGAVNLHTNLTHANLQWKEIDRGGGYFSYERLNSNHSIDGGVGGANNQNVHVWLTSENNYNQQWKKVSVGGGAFRLVKRNSTSHAIKARTFIGLLKSNSPLMPK